MLSHVHFDGLLKTMWYLNQDKTYFRDFLHIPTGGVTEIYGPEWYF